MDDQTQALNPEAEIETAQTESPTEEQTTGEIDEAGATDEVDTPEIPKKGAQSRIRELNSQVHSLTDKVAELTRPVGQQGQYAQYMPQPQKPLVGDDESIDARELERRMQEREQMIIQRAEAMADLRTNQLNTIERINRESEEVVKLHPELDPKSEYFDSELSDTIYEAVEAKVKADPNASLKSFVDRQMKLYKRGVSKEEAQVAETVARQASQTAIKPSQNKPVEKQFNELSIEEMEARLGKVEI